MNNGGLLDRPKPPALSLHGAELSVNGSSPHIDHQPPEPPADPDGYPMKLYHVEVTLETGDWTDGYARGRCEEAKLFSGEIEFCLTVEAHTKADALTKAVAATRTAIHHAGTATHRFGPDQLKLLDGDEPRQQLLRDRKPPVPWTLLSPSEIERYRSDEQFRREMRARWDSEWSSDDVNGGDCWAVTVVSVEITLPPEWSTAVRHGCWLSASGSGS